MQQDDQQLVSALIANLGATYWSVPANALAPWKERVEDVTSRFADAHPLVMKKFRAIIGDR